jgi:hypothetical protein
METKVGGIVHSVFTNTILFYFMIRFINLHEINILLEVFLSSAGLFVGQINQENLLIKMDGRRSKGQQL